MQLKKTLSVQAGVSGDNRGCSGCLLGLLTGMFVLQISYLMQVLAGQEEVVCLELYVKEATMPPMVLAIATPTTYKELVKNNDGNPSPPPWGRHFCPQAPPMKGPLPTLPSLKSL